MLARHRKSPNLPRELRERVWQIVGELLGRRAICGRCGATFATMDEHCTADLDEKCPGGEAIKDAEAKAKQRVGLT